MSKTNPNYSFTDLLNNKIKQAIGTEYNFNYDDVSKIEVSTIGEIQAISFYNNDDSILADINTVGSKFVISTKNDDGSNNIIGNNDLKNTLDLTDGLYIA